MRKVRKGEGKRGEGCGMREGRGGREEEGKGERDVGLEGRGRGER